MLATRFGATSMPGLTWPAVLHGGIWEPFTLRVLLRSTEEPVRPFALDLNPVTEHEIFRRQCIV